MKEKCLNVEIKNYEVAYSNESLDQALDSFSYEVAKCIKTKNITNFVILIDHPVCLHFAKCILLLKNIYSNITLECVLPFENVADNWSESNRDMLFEIFEECDYERIYQPHYTEGCVDIIKNELSKKCTYTMY